MKISIKYPDTTYNNDNTYETVSYMQNHGFELGHILDIHEVPCLLIGILMININTS